MLYSSTAVCATANPMITCDTSASVSKCDIDYSTDSTDHNCDTSANVSKCDIDCSTEHNCDTSPGGQWIIYQVGLENRSNSIKCFIILLVGPDLSWKAL